MGTTLIAAEKTDRVAGFVEIDPGYVDTICRRYEAPTGTAAELIATGESFDETARVRTQEAA